LFHPVKYNATALPDQGYCPTPWNSMPSQSQYTVDIDLQIEAAFIGFLYEYKDKWFKIAAAKFFEVAEVATWCQGLFACQGSTLVKKQATELRRVDKFF